LLQCHFVHFTHRYLLLIDKYTVSTIRFNLWQGGDIGFVDTQEMASMALSHFPTNYSAGILAMYFSMTFCAGVS
jgi:hypothetical protein